MKLARIILVLFLITGTTLVAADKLPEEKQLEVIANYLYITGQLDGEAMQLLGIKNMSDRDWPIKCGTPAAAEFFFNRDRLDQRLLKSMSASVAVRPVLSDSVDSPGGNFRIHYTTVGDDSVYQSTVDISPSNGVPDYVDKVAEICDSVFRYTIDTLGYPKPPVDTVAPSGGDGMYDIYLKNLQPGVFGFTWLDDTVDAMTGITYIELDNDYQGISNYYDQNPLDAVRVTTAHEYFHAVQFGLDATEYEPSSDGPQLYWMEMSATWMEEEQYDNINDYYGYLPFFFGDPSASLQRARDAGDLHQYGSVVFPIFLSEKYSRDIIKDIWMLCRSMGPGPSFLRAADSAIVMASSRIDTANGLPWARHFAEFALWNYFTGSRASLAPFGIGYSERSSWPPLAVIPNNKILAFESYPQSIPYTDNPLKPFHNAAEYIELRNLITLEYDTTYWNCDSIVPVDSCVDSTEVIDTTLGYEIRHIDSLLPIVFELDNGFNNPWGMSLVYYLKDFPDSVEVEGRLLQGTLTRVVSIIDPRQYSKVAVILSPASSLYTFFDRQNPMRLGIFADSDTSLTVRGADQFKAVVLPYPNPAVVKEMTDDLRFLVRLEAGQLSSYPYSTDAYMTVDIYTTAGDLVSSLAKKLSRPGIDDHFVFETPWNMKNRSGRDVVSGVYIAFVRLMSAESKGVLLAEDKVKLLLVR